MEKLIKFMKNRYGVDNLYNFLFLLVIIIFIIDMFFPLKILSIIELIILIIMIYRVLSKNITKRRKENQIYLDIKNNIKSIFTYKDKDYIYKKCPKCKTILKLKRPTKIGIKHTTCPTCKKRITALILKKRKIEIIRKKVNK